MDIPKARIIEVLQQRGDADLLERAQRDLPEQVDLDEHDLQADYDIDPGSLRVDLGDAAAELGLDDSPGAMA